MTVSISYHSWYKMRQKLLIIVKTARLQQALVQAGLETLLSC